ncbi:MAG: GspE/PulE family protein [Candidatus Falkowbacteria bacterium]
MAGFDSISSLLSKKPVNDDDTPQGKLVAKQKEIQLKKIEQEVESRAAALGGDYIKLVGFPISPEAIGLIPEDQARALNAVCFFYDGDNVRIGAINPQIEDVQELAATIDAKYFSKSRTYFISQTSLDAALEIYKTIPKVKKYDSGVEIKAEDLEKFKAVISSYRSLDEQINKVNISDIVTLILATAMKVGSSDIHIEAEENGVVVRLRVDGVLQEAAVLDRDKWKRIISRMKILAGVKINVEDRPQDGRYTIHLTDDKIDVRSSFLPTAFGESVVMRLLFSSSVGVPFESLGLRPENFKILQEQIDRPNGLILTTGPTGSGKTTTLYSILNKLNEPGEKIITLEDPIEYQLKGISQSQVDPAKGFTFAGGLRSILRQDPDIVMVGEIRDLETAEIAVQASLTGHLVLSTLHTNDAAGVIPRMIDMGVKPMFLVPSINCVIGQRLIRKLCPFCRVEHTLNEEEADRLSRILATISPRAKINIPSTLPTFYKAGVGCVKCNSIGYKGRVGLYELFVPDDKIKQLTMDGAPAFKILQQAIENGMLTMLQDGVLKVLNGETSLEEVYRVIGDFSYIDELYNVIVSQTMGRGIKLSEEDLAQAVALLAAPETIVPTIMSVPTSDIIKVIMALGVKSEAGDMHIEPTEHDVKFRFRIDGVMHDILSLSKEHYTGFLGEIKIMCGFATNVRRATMDGRFAIFMGKDKIDCRVSVISGGYGETVVIRLLSSKGEALDMTKMGIDNYSLKAILGAAQKTKGIIITTGPTGSGKTTTLYSLLKHLNTSNVKIITVEDPIEYQMEGLIQTQIDTEKGYTFAVAMRSLLRQNPNIMMIGEIRDNETASIAIEAALTGHLVLSTIHANSASGAISRFIGLGVERAQFANAIECAIGQRLVRKLCPYCKAETTLDDATMAEVKTILAEIKNPDAVVPETLKFYKAVGCEKCNKIGYKGRLGLYEVMVVDPEIQKAIQDPNSSDYDVERLAVERTGMVTMMQDGILKALRGDTSVEEVFRVSK